ncbi:hypothetical protein ACLEPN_15660 [Myxococcus sp. 1LA]
MTRTRGIRTWLHAPLVFGALALQLNAAPAWAQSLQPGAPAFGNLLVNPDASAGSMAGWTLLDHGFGWRVQNGAFRTSYDWSRRTQTVDLYAAGYDASIMAGAPPIFVSEQFRREYCPDRYYLKVELLNENHQVVASWNSQTQTNSGACEWGGEAWDELRHVFANYGPGVRYVRWEDGGKSSESWGGLYGAWLDNAVLSVRYPAHTTNLLVNGDASWGSLGGWTVTESGGEGWRVLGGGVDGSQSFRTSYGWSRRVQEVDLLAHGYSAAVLDRAPPVIASEWFRREYCPDWYYLKVSLLDANRQVVTSWDSGEQLGPGQCVWGGDSWHQLFHTFTGYGSGVRYVRWEDGGRDSEYWGGHPYGAVLDEAFLALDAPVSTPSSLARTASLGGASCGGVNQSPVWVCTEHFWWPPWQWGECHVSTATCCEGLEVSRTSGLCVPKAPVCATQVPGAQRRQEEPGDCTTTLTGQLMWHTAKPIANATVRIIPSDSTSILGKGSTDGHGNFTITVNSDFDFSVPATYRIRVLLQGSVASFHHPGCLSDDPSITFDFSLAQLPRPPRRAGSDIFVDLGSLQHVPAQQRLPLDSDWVADIWTAVQDGAAFARLPGEFDMARVDICAKPDVPGLAYDVGSKKLTFNPRLNRVPRDVVLHEYGHKVMHDAFGAYGYSEGSECVTRHAPRHSVDTQCAWIEGWATFFSLAVRNEPVMRYPSGAQFRFDPYNSPVVDGTDEGRVAAGLWGLYDRQAVSASSQVPFHRLMRAMVHLRAAKEANACNGACDSLRAYYWKLSEQLSAGQKRASNAVLRAQHLFAPGEPLPGDHDEL